MLGKFYFIIIHVVEPTYFTIVTLLLTILIKSFWM